MKIMFIKRSIDYKYCKNHLSGNWHFLFLTSAFSNNRNRIELITNPVFFDHPWDWLTSVDVWVIFWYGCLWEKEYTKCKEWFLRARFACSDINKSKLSKIWKYWKLFNANHSLLVHHFYKLFWVRSAKFRASIILSFYNHIIGIISFLYSQSETSTMTSSFNESWQQSKNEGYSDNKTDHINVPIVKIMNFEA